jgi:hypothetical protein
VKKGRAPIRRAAIVAPPSRRLSGGQHARRAEGVDAPGTAAKDAGATSEAVYCAGIHLSDPVTLTATSEMKMCRGLPSAVPRCSVEISRGPAFL